MKNARRTRIHLLPTLSVSACIASSVQAQDTVEYHLEFVSEFIAAFIAGDSLADFNNDGLFNFFDVSDFLSSFADGCPSIIELKLG